MRLPLKKVTIIGVGLIGGSFAKGIKAQKLANEVMGFGLHPEPLQKGIELGVLDCYSLDIAEAIKGSDLVFLAVPLGAMASVMKQIQPYLESQTILTDGGSSKMSVIAAVRSAFGYLPPGFVAGHPIAGKEKSGVEAADAMLYQNHKVILTPTVETDPEAVKTVTQLWQALGARVSQMTPTYHDEVLAATSHLPHLLAYGLVDLLNEHEELGNVFQYTAGGFRDFTRIASSDPTMWRDIAFNNKEAILKWLAHYQHSLTHMMQLIEQDDEDGLFELFSKAKSARDTHIVNRID